MCDDSGSEPHKLPSPTSSPMSTSRKIPQMRGEAVPVIRKSGDKMEHRSFEEDSEVTATSHLETVPVIVSQKEKKEELKNKEKNKDDSPKEKTNDTKQFYCPACPAVMKNLEDSEVHANSHYETVPVKQSQKTEDKKEDLRNKKIIKDELKIEKQDKENLICPVTGCRGKKNFRSVQAIRDHVKSHKDKKDFSDEQEIFTCPICIQDMSSVNEMWIHLQKHKMAGEKEGDKKVKRNGGTKSNVPRLDDNIEMDGSMVNVGMFLITAMVESAKENYLDLSTGASQIKWNKRQVREWIFKRIPDAKHWTQETLKRRFQDIEDMAAQFTMSKSLDSKLIPKRKEDTKYRPPQTEEEHQMGKLKEELDKIRYDIDNFQIKKKVIKEDPARERKAKQVYDKITENPDDSGEETKIKKENSLKKENKKLPSTLKNRSAEKYDKAREMREESVKNPATLNLDETFDSEDDGGVSMKEMMKLAKQNLKAITKNNQSGQNNQNVPPYQNGQNNQNVHPYQNGQNNQNVPPYQNGQNNQNVPPYQNDQNNQNVPPYQNDQNNQNVPPYQNDQHGPVPQYQNGFHGPVPPYQNGHRGPVPQYQNGFHGPVPPYGMPYGPYGGGVRFMGPGMYGYHVMPFPVMQNEYQETPNQIGRNLGRDTGSSISTDSAGGEVDSATPGDAIGPVFSDAAANDSVGNFDFGQSAGRLPSKDPRMPGGLRLATDPLTPAGPMPAMYGYQSPMPAMYGYQSQYQETLTTADQKRRDLSRGMGSSIFTDSSGGEVDSVTPGGAMEPAFSEHGMSGYAPGSIDVDKPANRSAANGDIGQSMGRLPSKQPRLTGTPMMADSPRLTTDTMMPACHMLPAGQMAHMMSGSGPPMMARMQMYPSMYHPGPNLGMSRRNVIAQTPSSTVTSKDADLELK